VRRERDITTRFIGFFHLPAYSQAMRSCRNFLSLLLVLALMLGTGQHLTSSAEMQRGAPAPNLAMSAMDSDMPMSGLCAKCANAMESDMSMSGLCDKCAKKGSATHHCFGACVGAQVIMPSAGFAPIWADATPVPFIEQHFSGSSAPPDLPPPKLAVLS
jgi:hypothetical protein